MQLLFAVLEQRADTRDSSQEREIKTRLDKLKD